MKNPETTNMRPRLSVSMIVKNEEQYLDGCLASVREIADEIIIADTGSTDRTIEIARQHGAQVFSFPWDGNYSSARNASLGHCTGEWVLYIDADERIVQGQTALVQELMKETDADAFNVAVRSVVRSHGTTETRIMSYQRLFRQSPNIKFEGRIHEQIALSIVRKGGIIKPSALMIEHLGYDQEDEKLRKKVEHKHKILLMAKEEEPQHPYYLYHLGNSYLSLENVEQAKEAFHQALQCDSLIPEMRSLILDILGEIELKLSRNFDGALDLFARSLCIAPRQLTARWHQAQAYFQKQEYDAALDSLQGLVTLRASSVHIAAMDIARDMILENDQIHHFVGECHFRLGQFHEACRFFEQAQNIDPVRDMWTSALFQIGMQEKNLHALEAAIALQPQHDEGYSILAAMKFSEGDIPGAREATARGFTAGAESPALRSHALNLALLMKDFKNASAHLEALTRLLPGTNFDRIRKSIQQLSNSA